MLEGVGVLRYSTKALSILVLNDNVGGWVSITGSRSALFFLFFDPLPCFPVFCPVFRHFPEKILFFVHFSQSEFKMADAMIEEGNKVEAMCKENGSVHFSGRTREG